MIRQGQLTTRELVLADPSLTVEERNQLVAAIDAVGSAASALREADAQVEKADRKHADLKRRLEKATSRRDKLRTKAGAR